MKVYAIDHVQLAMPPNQEDLARAFYGDILGLTEIPKPPELAKRESKLEKGNPFNKDRYDTKFKNA